MVCIFLSLFQDFLFLKATTALLFYFRAFGHSKGKLSKGHKNISYPIGLCISRHLLHNKQSQNLKLTFLFAFGWFELAGSALLHTAGQVQVWNRFLILQSRLDGLKQAGWGSS